MLAANGIGKEAFWNSLLAGESGIGPITRCDVENLDSRIAGEVGDFNVNDYLPQKIKAKRVSRNSQLTAAASFLALKDAQIDPLTLKPTAPLSISLGISMAGFDFIETEIRRIIAKGNQFMLPTVVGCIHIASASTTAELIGIPCNINVLSNSCVGGVDAIAKTYADLRDGRTDIALAGGSDAPIETSLVAGFCAARMLCTDNENPKKACRPFDMHRTRGVLAEGSCIVVMETLEHALDRGAEPYAEIVGYGTATDPSSLAGEGLGASMRNALNNASIAPSAVDYISAHGPSEITIDQTETDMIHHVFKHHAYSVPISSIKGATGNPLAAGGALQIAATSLAIKQALIPPTTNYHVRDPDCDLDYVPGEPRACTIEYALINSHGIGKVNSSIILKRVSL